MFLLPKNYSFRLMRDKKFQQIARSAISKPVKKGIEAIAQSQRSLPKKTDGDKRAFFKVAGIAGAGLLASQLLPHKAEALIMGSTPAANVVGVKNSSDARIDPATETTLAAIKTQTDKFTFSGSNLLTESSGGGGGASAPTRTAGPKASGGGKKNRAPRGTAKTLVERVLASGARSVREITEAAGSDAEKLLSPSAVRLELERGKVDKRYVNRAGKWSLRGKA